MYIVTIQNGNTITEIHGENEKAYSGSVVKGINAIDSFSFSLLPSNAGFNELHDFQTLVKVYNTNNQRYEFYGRVLYSSSAMSESGLITKEVTCESYMGFLCDSIQNYVETRNWTVRGLLEYIIAVHNSQVEEYKRIQIGTVDVTDPNDNLYLGIQYKNTWETLKEKLLDVLGGEIRLRVVGDTIYLDYLVEIGEHKSVAIALSRNMKAITREKDPSQYVTRLLPLGGKKSEDSEERIDISSVNNGGKYIDDVKAIARYGVHVGVVEFDDVYEPQNLLRKGEEWIAANNKLLVKYSATALDLSLIGLDIDDIDVYNYYPIQNALLGIDDEARIIKKTINICAEVDSTVEFGDKFESFSDIQLRQKEVIEGIEKKTGANTVSIAKIEKEVTSTSATIEMITQTTSDQSEAIAQIRQETAENAASIENIAKVQTEQAESVARISQQADENGAQIVIAVGKSTAAEEAASDASKKVSNGAYIIARVNEDGSDVQISADKVNLEGYATFSSLENEGETTINGGNVKTGKISGGGDNAGFWDLETGEFSAGNGNLFVNEKGEVVIKGYVGAETSSGFVVLGFNDAGNATFAVANHSGGVLTFDDSGLMVGDSGFASTESGITSEIEIGGVTLKIVHGIIVGCSSLDDSGGESGGSDPEITNLEAPRVSIVDGDTCNFVIYNENGVGTIEYYIYRNDSKDGHSDTEIMTSDAESVTGCMTDYIDYPYNSGQMGIVARVSYNNGAVVSEWATCEVDCA